MYSVLVFKTRALDLNDIETSKSLTSSQISQSSAFSFLDSRRCLWDVYSPTDAVEIEWKHFAGQSKLSGGKVSGVSVLKIGFHDRYPVWRRQEH